MFCSNCGTYNADGVAYCSKCGTALQQTAPVAPMSYVPFSMPGKGMAVASLVLGIVSLIVAALICGTLAIVFGSVAKKRGYIGGMATAGVVLGVIGVASWLLMMLFCGSCSVGGMM